jgi:Glycosyltransferase family 87
MGRLLFVVLLVCLVVITASCASVLAGIPGVGGLIPAVYVLAVADVVTVIEVLSLFEAVSRVWLLAVQAVLALVAVLLVVVLRPVWPDLNGLTAFVRAIVGSRVLALTACVVGVAWAYQAILALTVPPNTWDALTYHMARVAAWFHHGGVFWIPDAPTDRLNEFQPGGEELGLALVAVAQDPRPYAIPQFLAGCAFIASAGVSSRALGLSREASAFAMLLAATVPMVVMQATTAQNDLVAAALVGSAAALIIRGGSRPLIVAGIAVGVGAGVKLTVLLAVPVLALLALTWGWRALRAFGIATAVSLAALGTAGIWRNAQHTGHLLGDGGGRVEHESDGALGSALVTSYRIGYRLLDLSGLNDLYLVVTAAGIVTAGAVYVTLRRRGVPACNAVRKGLLIALPLLSAVVFAAIASWLKAFAELTNINMNPEGATSSTFRWGLHTIADEDLSYLGFLGGWLALSSLIVVALGVAGRVAPRTTLLGLAIPLFVVFLALHSTYNAWLGRFLLVPLAIAVPLLAYAWEQPFRTTLAAVAVLTLVGTSVDNNRKPFDSRPWNGGRNNALRHSFEPRVAASTAALDGRLKGTTCVVAVVGGDDPSYLLFGPHLERRVTYARGSKAALDRTAPIVLGPGADSTAVIRAGWRVVPVLRYWRLARPGTTPVANQGSRDACARRESTER